MTAMADEAADLKDFEVHNYEGLNVRAGTDRIVVDYADKEVQIDASVVRGWMHGAAGPYFVVELRENRKPLITFGSPGEGVGRVTYEVTFPAQGTNAELAHLRRLD